MSPEDEMKIVKSDGAIEEGASEKICIVHSRSRFSCPAPRKEGVGEAWKEFFTGNISLLGRGGREKGCGEMKRKFGTRVKWFRENYWISRGLPPPRGVSLRGNGGHEFSFFFLTRSRAVSIRSRKKNEKNIS